MRAALLAVLLLAVAGCERCAPDQVAVGVGRLSVRSAAAVALLVDADSKCGFASDAAAVTVDGDVGGEGTRTIHVDKCTIALGAGTGAASANGVKGAGTVVGTDCAGTKTTATGTITVTASKIIHGHLTGDDANPIIPASTDAVTIALENVKADGFDVADSKTGAHFAIDGSFAATVTPLLFVDDAAGVCSIPSSNAIIAGLAYQPSTVHVNADGHDFDADVATSSIGALAGKTAGGENRLSGSVTVFGSAQKLAAPLDPDYDAAAFEKSWSCAAGLASPLSSSCALGDALGENAARLVIRSLGVVTSLVDADTTCGFASSDVLGRIVVDGSVGHDGAVARYGIARPCRIEVPDTVLSTDCNGVATHVQGAVEVTGAKDVTGWATGDTATPVVPSSRDAVHFNLVADLQGLTVSVDGQPALVADAGLLSGEVRVRTGEDASTGACSRPTPAAEFDAVSLSGGSLHIVTDAANVAVSLGLSAVSAQNGAGPSSENTLSGDITVDHVTTHVDGAKLDPGYDAVAFVSGFICESGLLVPLDDGTCTFRPPLGQVTARVALDAVDAALALLDADTACGFANAAAPNSADACAVGPLDDAVAASDCTTSTHATGSFTATATRTLDPSTAAAAHIAISSLVLDGFQASLGGNGDATLTLTGTITGAVDEGFAEHGDGAGGGTGVFDVASPVRKYSALSIDADATLVLQGLTFDYHVGGSALEGTRGALDGVENELVGTIVVDDQSVVIPVDRRDRTLEPGYDAAAFVSRYSCEPGFFAPVPPG